jgi:hypothetical protein
MLLNIHYLKKVAIGKGIIMLNFQASIRIKKKSEVVLF